MPRISTVGQAKAHMTTAVRNGINAMPLKRSRSTVGDGGERQSSGGMGDAHDATAGSWTCWPAPGWRVIEGQGWHRRSGAAARRPAA